LGLSAFYALLKILPETLYFCNKPLFSRLSCHFSQKIQTVFQHQKRFFTSFLIVLDIIHYGRNTLLRMIHFLKLKSKTFIQISVSD